MTHRGRRRSIAVFLIATSTSLLVLRSDVLIATAKIIAQFAFHWHGGK